MSPVRKYFTGIAFASDTKERRHIMSTIVLINPFEVPQGQEEAFLKGWHAAAEHLRQAPGFLSTRLHESLDPQAKFRFVNVAEWESPQHFQAAVRTEAFEQISRKMPFTASPALYRVIAEEQMPHSL
jgi:heme oxygenase (mycobilin-producing)